MKSTSTIVKLTTVVVKSGKKIDERTTTVMRKVTLVKRERAWVKWLWVLSIWYL